MNERRIEGDDTLFAGGKGVLNLNVCVCLTGVPQTIANLAIAGIKIWVLTGDKQGAVVFFCPAYFFFFLLCAPC